MKVHSNIIDSSDDTTISWNMQPQQVWAVTSMLVILIILFIFVVFQGAKNTYDFLY